MIVESTFVDLPRHFEGDPDQLGQDDDQVADERRASPIAPASASPHRLS
jgi:hypothetical protein